MIPQYYFQSCHAVGLLLFLKASQHYLSQAPHVCSWDRVVMPPKLQQTGICAVYSSDRGSQQTLVGFCLGFYFWGYFVVIVTKC